MVEVRDHLPHNYPHALSSVGKQVYFCEAMKGSRGYIPVTVLRGLFSPKWGISHTRIAICGDYYNSDIGAVFLYNHENVTSIHVLYRKRNEFSISRLDISIAGGIIIGGGGEDKFACYVNSNGKARFIAIFSNSTIAKNIYLAREEEENPQFLPITGAYNTRNGQSDGVVVSRPHMFILQGNVLALFGGYSYPNIRRYTIQDNDEINFDKVITLGDKESLKYTGNMVQISSREVFACGVNQWGRSGNSWNCNVYYNVSNDTIVARVQYLIPSGSNGESIHTGPGGTTNVNISFLGGELHFLMYNGLTMGTAIGSAVVYYKVEGIAKAESFGSVPDYSQKVYSFMFSLDEYTVYGYDIPNHQYIIFHLSVDNPLTTETVDYGDSAHVEVHPLPGLDNAVYFDGNTDDSSTSPIVYIAQKVAYPLFLPDGSTVGSYRTSINEIYRLRTGNDVDVRISGNDLPGGLYVITGDDGGYILHD